MATCIRTEEVRQTFVVYGFASQMHMNCLGIRIGNCIRAFAKPPYVYGKTDVWSAWDLD